MMVGKVVDVKTQQFNTEKNVIHPSEQSSLFHVERLMNNYGMLKETFVITINDGINKIDYPERMSELKITAQWYAAVDCLGASLYAGSIIFATMAVEAALSHDLRLERLRNNNFNKGWIRLNTSNLRAAAKRLPVNRLLNDEESLDHGNIVFTERRNKIAHGDFYGFSNIRDNIKERIEPSDGEFLDVTLSEPTHLHAIDQINKAKEFLVAWASQKPELRMH